MLGKRRQGVHREVLGRRRFVRLLLKPATGDVAEEEGFQRMRQLGRVGMLVLVQQCQQAYRSNFQSAFFLGFANYRICRRLVYVAPAAW